MKKMNAIISLLIFQGQGENRQEVSFDKEFKEEVVALTRTIATMCVKTKTLPIIGDSLSTEERNYTVTNRDIACDPELEYTFYLEVQ